MDISSITSEKVDCLIYLATEHLHKMSIMMPKSADFSYKTELEVLLSENFSHVLDHKHVWMGLQRYYQVRNTDPQTFINKRTNSLSKFSAPCTITIVYSTFKRSPKYNLDCRNTSTIFGLRLKVT